MKTKDIKEIQITAKEWFDKTYGNSYFSAEIYVNGVHVHTLPFQYGYGDSYIYASYSWLKDNIFSKQLTKKLANEPFYNIKNIAKCSVFTSKQDKCLKRELSK